MTKEKQKRSSRRLSRRMMQFLLMTSILGIVLFLKREAIGFRLYNVFNPVYGELIFHSDFDGDGIPQLYHLTFNTGFKYTQVTQLTDLPSGAAYGVYSPDGTQIAFQSGDSVSLMNADGTNIRELVREYSDPPNWSQKSARVFRPVWINPSQIVYERAIGWYVTDMLWICPVTIPVVYNTHTGIETPILQMMLDGIAAPQDGVWLRFSSGTRGMWCGGYHAGDVNVNMESTGVRSAFDLIVGNGFGEQAYDVFSKSAALARSGHALARVMVYPYPDMVSGIQVFADGKWSVPVLVHSDTVSWSPDDRYLVYDARHPDGTWVLAITSEDGKFTYPLLGNDGRNYFAPDWHP